MTSVVMTSVVMTIVVMMIVMAPPFQPTYIKMLFPDMEKHVLQHPDGSVAVVVAPVAGSL